MSGGLAIDCGVHEYDLAEWLTGRRVLQVSAWALPIVDAGRRRRPVIVDNLVAVLELDGGAVATVDLSRNARYGDDVRTEVLGSNGALLVDLLPTSRTRLGDAERRARAARARWLTTRWPPAWPRQAGRSPEAVARWGRRRAPGATASVRATRIGYAVIEAGSTGRAVELAPEER